VLVEPLGPNVIAGLGVDQLHIDPESVATTLYGAFKHVADVQFPPDLPHVYRLPFVGECAVRAITNEPLIRDKSVVRLSVTPSTK